MEENSETSFYITTPIYYVNDVPHIGHAYTTIIADAISRFKKLAGYDVFFLTGTDEHGQKVEKSAAEKGMTPIQLADKVVVRFKNLWEALDIAFDSFIRTTQPSHEQGVQKIFQKLKDKGDIYKGIYEGWYCVSDETFLSEDVSLEDGGHKICPDCRQKANVVSEECYFFKLSAYEEPLIDFYQKNPTFVRPQSRMNEVVSFVRQGLKDLSITRTTVKWGISLPDDSSHTIYVWFDALHSYLTGIGYDWDSQRLDKYWPATVHLIGKDILRHHAVFWPAFLIAAGFPLPKTIYAHGWWLKDQTKMSKSRGNVLDPWTILNAFGSDPLRYFLLREIPIGLDGNFSHEGFIHRVNSDLANDLGNLVQRLLTMIHNYFGGQINTLGEETDADMNLRLEFDAIKEKVSHHFEDYAINKALEEIWVFINSVNKYLADNAPWKLAKDDSQRARLGRILYQATCALRGISYFVYPVLPESSQKMWQLLGEKKPLEEESYSELAFFNLKPDQKTQQSEPLFPRVDLKHFLQEEESMDIITFDDFKRMDLRVGEIIEAERVEGTDKLVKMQVNIGTETRQMIGGIADKYAPEELIGKKVVVIVNLKTAVIRGIESQGMLLAAEVGGKAIIPFFTEDVPAGAKVL
ncbi:MAG: methionine--tRNA ligase [Candidatus Aminicenantaceae bacterium]